MGDLRLHAADLPAVTAGFTFALLTVLVLEMRARGTAPRRAARALVRATILALVALALATPTLAREEAAPRRLILLVDRAARRVEGGEAAAAELERRARGAALAGGLTLSVVAFDDRVRADVPAPGPGTGAPGAPAAPDAAGTATSRLAPALATAALLAADDEAAAVVVASDGRADANGAAAETARLRARGIPVRAAAIPAPAPGRPAPPTIDALDVPDEVRGPFAVRASVVGAAPGATARLLVDGAPPAGPVGAAPVPLAADGTVAFDGLVLPPGLHDVAVVVDPPADAGPAAPADPATPVLRRALVRVARPPRALVVTGGPTGAILRRTLSSQGFEVSLVDPAEAITAFGAGGGARVDLVVLDADAVTDETAKAPFLGAIAERVRAGAGLLLAAGASSESWAALARGPLADLLPLVPEEPAKAPLPPEPPPPLEPPKPAPPEPDDAPEPGAGLVAETRPEDAMPISLLLVIDRSGSMSIEGKLGMAIRAAEEATVALASTDRVGLISFSDEPTLDTPMTAAGLASATGLVPPLEAAGNTDIYSALALAARTMAAERSPIRHVLLLTDGIQTGSAYFTDLVRRMAEERITLTTVGLGQSIDEFRLKALARLGNGRFFFAPTAQDLPRVLTRDTRTVVEQRASEVKRARMNDPNRLPPPKPPKEKTPPPKPAPLPPETSRAPAPHLPPPTAPPEPLVRRRPHEATLGLDETTFPRVGPPLAAAPLTPTSIVLARAGGAPVLGAGRAGLGRVLVLALPITDPGFVGWADATRLVAQAARSVTSPSEEGPVAVVRVASGPDGDRLVVAIPEGVDPSDVAGHLRVRRRGADGDRDAPLLEIDTRELAFRLPGGAGDRAAVLVEATSEEGGDVRALPPIAYLPSAEPAARRGSDAAALERGLGLSPDPAAPSMPAAPPVPRAPGSLPPDLFDVPRRTRTDDVPLLPWLAALAALLLPLDVALHRRGKEPT